MRNKVEVKFCRTFFFFFFPFLLLLQSAILSGAPRADERTRMQVFPPQKKIKIYIYIKCNGKKKKKEDMNVKLLHIIRPPLLLHVVLF